MLKKLLGFTLTLGVSLTAPPQKCQSNEKSYYLNLDIIYQASELHIFFSLFFGQAIFSLRDLQLLKTQTLRLIEKKRNLQQLQSR